jgi:hypothetical protein
MKPEISVTRDPSLKHKSPLRRYMDLAKFVDLLKTQSLYLRRADGFTDRFEGALTPSIKAAIDSMRDSGRPTETAEVFYERCRKGTFVSCWTFGEKDNMALWQLFGGSASSVAINTTTDRLTRMCLGWTSDSSTEKVNYIDHFEDPDMVIGRYTDLLRFKHEAFEFKREVRLMVPMQENWKDNPSGIRMPIGKLDDLVTSVVVAPNAGRWFFELVQDLANKYELKANVKMSQLSTLPT